jgi:hypothetical protein
MRGIFSQLFEIVFIIVSRKTVLRVTLAKYYHADLTACHPSLALRMTKEVDAL